MWLLNVFIFSLFAVLFLLSVKMKEINNHRQSFVGRFLTKGDPIIRSIIKYFQGFFNHYRERTFFIFLVHVPNRVETFFKDLRNRSHGYYHGANTKIRGKRDLGDRSVSPYLRSMSITRPVDGGKV